MQLIHGSGNVFTDFGHRNAGREQARAITAAQIIHILDERKLSTRDAEKLTGFLTPNSLIFVTHSFDDSRSTR